MDVLILGGTVFLGRAVVSEAQALGADVTIFNRGTSAPPPAGVSQVVGDRTDAADLEQLAGRTFDVVVDTCGYEPADVARSAALLAMTCGHYAFVSSINVYPGWPAAEDYHAGGVHQGDPEANHSDVPAGLSPSESYGWLKAGCELAAIRALGADRTSVLRGGCIVGPHDSAVGRLPWWIARVARGGEVLVPGAPDDPISLIDARDLAGFALSGAAGTFEAAGPPGRDTRGDLMAACRAATGSNAQFTYVGDEWLVAHGVEAWTEVPLWVPGAPSVFAHDTAAAQAAGLSWRPLRDTVADTWAWQQSVPGGWRRSERTPGLAPDREAELLAAWHSR
ncbi:MAG: NAD-dependent epimerase/dehydratase family protein [Pseudonocardiales bacterium]